MKAAVSGVFIFRLAVRAHFEFVHRGVGPVIRDIADNSKAGAAVGAVGERIAVAAVEGVEDFMEALGAGGDIRGDKLVFAFFGDARADFKVIVISGCSGFGGYISRYEIKAAPVSAVL